MNKLKNMGLLLIAVFLIFIPHTVSAELLGGNISILTQRHYDQQNPHIIHLPDKNLYFVVWEDWRNYSTTRADIYGRFIKADGTLCGSEVPIAVASGNQTVPRAAYRDGNLIGDTFDRIMVVWQDTRRTLNAGGYVYYRVIDISSSVFNESTCSGYTPSNANQVPFEDDLPATLGTQSYVSSRTMPKIAYDFIYDKFITVWVESRTTLKTSKFQPFYLNAVEPSWQFGDTQFVGYAAIDGYALSYQTGTPTIIQQWMDSGILGDVYSRARLLSRSSSSHKVVSVFEFFDEITNVDVSCDTTTTECLFIWEGIKGTFTRTDECTDVPSGENDGVCDANDIVGSTAVTEYKPTNKEIFAIFEKNIPLAAINSLRVSNSTNGAFYPSIGFDPISKRFLAVWEDTRNGANTKIYGQLIYSGSGLYNQNFIISYQDTNNDGQQDTNVANSRQTRPFVSYDSVNQRFFVIWQDGRNSTYSLENLDIYGQKVDAEGSLRGGNYAVDTNPYNQYIPTIAFNEIDNQFLTVWKDARNLTKYNCGTGSQPCGSDVFAQRFTLDNSAITLLNIDNTLLSPVLLSRFENPSGSGRVEVGLFATQSFKIRNTGDTILKIDYIDNTCGGTLSGISPFSFDGLPSELNARGGATLDLVPSAELTLTVRFTPLSAGSYNRCFIIETDGGMPRVNLSALSIESNIEVAPSSHNFGSVYIGQYAEKTFVVKNAGLANLRIYSLNNPSSPFSIQSDGCSGKSITPGSVCNIVVRFTPTSITSYSSNFGINSNDPDSPTVSVNISGTGIATPPLPDITVSSLSVNFGYVVSGQSSQQNITIRNDGTAALVINSISGPNSPFSIASNNCPLAPSSIGVNGSCQITIRFSPLTLNTFSSSIAITSNDPDEGSVSIILSGIGALPPTISVVPTSVSFGTIKAGTSASSTITVKNTGQSNLIIRSVSSPSIPFSITGNTCTNQSVEPNGSCSITATFSPKFRGKWTSSFSISSNDPAKPKVSVSLNGAATL